MNFEECEVLINSLRAAVDVIERMHQRGIHDPDRFAQILAYSFGASLKLAEDARKKGLVVAS